MECERSALRDAILRVWTPAVGVRTFVELIEGNAMKIIDSQGINGFSHIIAADHIPIDFVPQYFVDSCFDTKPPFEIGEVIISGSWSEGLFFYGSKNVRSPDLDRMCVLKHIKFSEDDQKAGSLTLREDTPFVYAYITDENAITMWSDFLVDEESSPHKRLSSRKLKEKLQENYNKSALIQDDKSNDVGTGAAMEMFRNDHNISTINSNILVKKCLLNIDDPSLRVVILDNLRKGPGSIFTGCDIVLSISCDGWPSCAKEWITRHRIWPSDNIVQKIIHDGFHIVPKSSTEGDFRLSFSYAETTLIESLTKLQHKVLRSFKAVVKYHQNSWSPNIKEIITTYHLKTVAFWHFEKVAQNTFTEEVLVSHLVLLFQELAEALRKRELPMYFMPKVNLFTNVDDPKKATDIADKIKRLCSEFSQIIIAVQNVTFGFGRACSILENTRKLCEYVCSLGKDRKRSEETLSNHDQTIQKVSTAFDSVQKVLECSPLNLIANLYLDSHEAEQEPRGPRLAKGLKSNMKDDHSFHTKEFIDLD